MDKTVPILILSHPRTGSTLLRCVLDTHPEIASPAELELGQICELLLTAVELAQGDATRRQGIYAARTDHCAQVRDVIDGVLERYCKAKGKTRWCEKSPNNLFTLDFVNAVFPDAQCICLHRHGLDAVRSLIELGVLFSAKRRPGPRGEASVVVGAIDNWCRMTERLLAFERAYSSRALRVRYEDFVSVPDATLVKIYSFLGVEPLAGLHQAVFSARHDNGPGDSKVAGCVAVETDRMGRGQTLDISRLPVAQRRRMAALLQTLGY